MKRLPTSLHRAIKVAQHLGISVTKPRRTGEVLFTFDNHRVRHNARRKDLSAAARVLFRRAIAAKEVS